LRYRIQYLDISAALIRELFADARSATSAGQLIAGIDWPPKAISVRVLDAHGCEVHSENRGDAKTHALTRPFWSERLLSVQRRMRDSRARPQS
jgi:hypothetical protein